MPGVLLYWCYFVGAPDAGQDGAGCDVSRGPGKDVAGKTPTMATDKVGKDMEEADLEETECCLGNYRKSMK